jgi:hypothetical protein
VCHSSTSTTARRWIEGFRIASFCLKHDFLHFQQHWVVVAGKPHARTCEPN